MATTFITRAGDRIQAEFPPSLLKPGVSQAQRERYLISQGVLPDPDAPVVEQVEPQELVQQVIDTAALSSVEARLAALEGRPLPELPSPDRVEQLIVSAMRAGVSKEEVTVVADEATARINTTAAGCEERLSTVEAREQALVEQVSSTLSEATTAVAESIASASQQLAAFESEVETAALSKAAEIAAKQVGPQGLAGSGVTIIDADPLKTDAQSIGRMAFGRALVPGDCVLHPGEDALRFYRWNGDAWDKRAGEIVNRVIAADVKVSALDNSSRQTTNITNIASGGSGGGLERLLVSTLRQSQNIKVADSSNWSALGAADPTGGTIWLEILDPNTAQSMTVAGAFDVGLIPGLTRIETYAVTGALYEGANAPDIEIDAARSGSVIIPPAAVGIVPIPGAVSTQINVRIGANIGGGTDYLLRGGIMWLLPGTGQAYMPGDIQPAPAWTWG